jgi:hypothetical protein
MLYLCKPLGCSTRNFQVGFQRMTDGFALVCERSIDADIVDRVVRLAGRGVHVVQDDEFESHHTLVH